MKRQLGWLVLGLMLATPMVGCKQKTTPKEPETQREGASSRPVVRRGNTAAERLARVPDSWIKARVTETQARLGKTKTGKLLWAALEAHGGLNTWFSNGPLAFRFAYRPVKGKARDTHQVIDTWSSRARHTHTADKSLTFGWDGKVAWRMPKGKQQPIAVRFWSLTPFYFVGIPFVLSDKGIHLKLEDTIKFEGRTYHQLRVTFGSGVGDAPKDFYVAYIDTETKRIGGVRYIVSYPGFFKKGGHSPEKFMAFDGQQKVGGVTFPKAYRTFKWDGKKPGKLVTNTTLSDVAFRPKLKGSYFSVPQGAETFTGYLQPK